MKKARIIALLCAAGLSVSAVADHPIPTIPGPFTVSQAITALNLNGGTIPAGTYLQTRVSYDWGNQVGNAYSSEAVWVLSSQNTFPGGTVYTNPGSTFGSFNDNFDRPGMMLKTALDTPYSGGQPLFLLLQQVFADSTADWSNISVTMVTAAAVAPTPDMIAPALVFPAIGSPPSVINIATELTENQTHILKLTVPAGGITVANGRYLDIDTENSMLSPANDTYIALFSSTGQQMAFDDDDGTGFMAQLTFGGSGTPRPPASVANPYDGRDGTLPSGDYYLYFSSAGDDNFYPVTRSYHGFNYFNTSTSITFNPGEMKVNIATGTVAAPAVLPCSSSETEPNDSKALANAKSLANGLSFCGNTTGIVNSGGGANTYDLFLVNGPTPAAGQILKNRLLYSSGTASHVATIRGRAVNNSVIDTASDVTVQTAAAVTSPARYLQWFSMGTNPTANPNAYKVYVRLGGSGASTSDYRFELQVDPITPINAGAPFAVGAITFSTEGMTDTDTDFLVLDSNLNPIPALMADDGAGTQASITGTLAAGTYYLAVSNYNVANNIASPPDDGYPDANILDFPGVIVNGSNTTGTDVSCQIIDSSGTPRIFTLAKEGGFDVRFIKLQVGTPGNGGCQPADIADDQGTPLPSAQPNTGVNEGDYNAFFGGFFQALPYCDQWDDQGTPLPSAQPNTGVNEGDYNGFFATFFNGCP